MPLGRENSFWGSVRGKLGDGSGSEHSSRHDGSRPLYDWTPLDSEKEIRIMTILPSKTSGPVECMISRHPRYATPVYEAISHNPMEKDFQGTILCEGRALSVSSTCEAAARALRAGIKNHKQPRRVWIDEVCINQADAREKSAQISQVGDVFYYAQRTIVYLGEADATTALIRNMFHDIEYDRWQLDRYLLHESRVIAAWRDFFARPWFNRTWIIPAVILSPDVALLMGKEELRWSALMHLVNERELAQLNSDDAKQSSNFGQVMLNVDLPYIVRLFKDVQHTQKSRRLSTPLMQVGEKRPPSANSAVDSVAPSDLGPNMSLNYDRLVEMLESSINFQCLDPRDRLYAILAVFGNPVPELLLPDYNKTTGEVYTDLARFLLKIDATGLLSYSGGDRADKNLPSWVVDWRFPPLAARLPQITRRLRPHAGYLKESKAMRHKVRGHSLIIRGRVIDKVSTLGEPCLATADAPERPVNIFRDIDEWEYRNARLLEAKQGFKSSKRVVCTRDCRHPHRLPELVRNRLGLVPTSITDASIPIDDAHEGITRMKDLVSNGLTAVQEHFYSNGRFVNREKEKEFDLIAKRCVGRRLIVSESGLSGLGPAGTVQGDYICIILGCKLPFVLRPLGGGRWRIVGECLVGGIMHGEGVAWLDWANVESDVPEEPFRDFAIQ